MINIGMLLSISVSLFVFSTYTVKADFPLNADTQLNKEEAIAIFSDRVRTCSPDRRKFVMEFHADGKIEARNNRGSDRGTWSVDDKGRVSVKYRGKWRNWSRLFYKNPSNPNEIG